VKEKRWTVLCVMLNITGSFILTPWRLQIACQSEILLSSSATCAGIGLRGTRRAHSRSMPEYGQTEKNRGLRGGQSEEVNQHH